MGGLTLMCFARASYAELDPGTTQCAYEPFFGRQSIVDELVYGLQNEPRFLAVFGPSGCGKSSLVQAGLIPRLRTGAVPGSDRWSILVTRPTDDSFEPLLNRLEV